MLLQQFSEIVSKYHVSSTSVLVGVSGGMDSVVLAHLCAQAGIKFSMAHCNFQLRGSDSDADQSLVEALGRQYAVPVHVRKFDTGRFAADHKLSIQEAARHLRYTFFDELRNQYGYQYTLLAHHADDQIETVLMNFFRGTGIDGLTGMPEHNVKQANCIRPLLQVRKEHLSEYAAAHKLRWREDASNQSNKYSRNFFRNVILPSVRTIYPAADENILNNLERFQQTGKLYHKLVAGLKNKVCRVKGNEVHIPVLQLMKYKDTSFIYEIIRDYGFSDKQVQEVIKLADAGSGKYIRNDSFQLIRHRHWFIIAPVAAATDTLVIDKEQETIPMATGNFSQVAYPIAKWKLNQSAHVAQLDAKEIQWPLILRRWKQGDYFYPLGMRKKKKLSRCFIDSKLSKVEKEKIWVVESDKKIIWVVGYRIDDRYKITDKTKQVLELSVTSP